MCEHVEYYVFTAIFAQICIYILHFVHFTALMCEIN